MKNLTLITIVLSFLLINLGGYVHNTGSSLACPDWPLCHGQVMPEMKAGVLIEHSHRLLASLVGFLTLIIALLAWKKSRETTISYAALVMVMAQGILGGITVIYKLPPFVSTAHLGLSMIFICTMIYLHHRLVHPEKYKSISNIKPYLMTTLIIIYLQILLGALMRHLGLGGVCGVGYEHSLLCSGQVFPSIGTEQIHMSHRFLAVVAGAVVIMVNFFIIKKAKGKSRLLPAISVILVLLQILLGIMTVGSGFRPLITMFHLGGAALLLSVIWKEYLNQSHPPLSFLKAK